LDISSFTGVSKHDFNKTEHRISFIWREDRIWSSNKYSTIMIKNSKLLKYALLIQQNLKIRRFFNLLRRTFQNTIFTVAGFGKSTKFPSWIDDLRVDRYDEDSERQLCISYSESRLVVGIHGSNMLLPTAHAGMAIDLMPMDRWGNFSQDVIFSPALDVRLASYRFRYLPVNIKLDLLAHIATEQLRWHDYFNKQWTQEINL
jgi:hypothetical protein